MICKQFLITGMIWAILGGLMSVLFRLQLGYPDQLFLEEDVLGNGPNGKIQLKLIMHSLRCMVPCCIVLTAVSAELKQFRCKQARAYGFALSEYVILLVFLVGKCSDVDRLLLRPVLKRGWTIYPLWHWEIEYGIRRMDYWITAMALFMVSAIRWLELCYDDSQYADEGHSMTRLPLTIWALLYRNPGCTFPRTSFRLNIIAVHHAGTSLSSIFFSPLPIKHFPMKAVPQSCSSIYSGSWGIRKCISLSFRRWDLYQKLWRSTRVSRFSVIWP